MILDAEAFHILSADIDNKIYIGIEVTRRGIVGNGFDDAAVTVESAFDEILAVSGYRTSADLDPIIDLLINVS